MQPLADQTWHLYHLYVCVSRSLHYMVYIDHITFKYFQISITGIVWQFSSTLRYFSVALWSKIRIDEVKRKFDVNFAVPAPAPTAAPATTDIVTTFAAVLAPS